ncbi:hypothetical protein [Limnohabitans sp. 63ED37-2]|uniref:hypothetical protein n=1 Tax=Limnohabitans sp. 63ED37-2 TaxID=1678128 RepID=UPI000706C200|nr:hypothetical protein [Limnohabitans sp. 63ED37-2]ALK87542.1 hypothetical protein L63ED372_00313 [Limnohabitans sp. 63ED37-2]
MPSWSRFWQRVAHRPVRQAWGLACDGAGWALVGLSWHKAVGVRVDTTEKIATANDPPGSGFGWGLSQVGGRSRQRVSVGLAEDELIAGVLVLPAQLPRDDWASEVQLEVAQLLCLAPDEVNFDFQPDPVSDGLLSRVHWVGCDQARIRAIRDGVRMAGWRLDSVEPASHAAHRAVCHLKGGLDSLLTQAPQDWQFDLTPHLGVGHNLPSGAFDAAADPVLRQALQSTAGPRLVASGLALKAWL